MNIQELRDHVCEEFPDLCPLFSIEFGDGVLQVSCERVHSAAADLRSIGFDRLGMVTAVDRIEHLEMVYRLQSRAVSAGMFLKCELPRDEPVTESLVDLYPAALWQEREVYDLFGVEFQGHPDLRRILLPPDFEGHPLLKDYEDDRVVKRPDYI